MAPDCHRSLNVRSSGFRWNNMIQLPRRRPRHAYRPCVAPCFTSESNSDDATTDVVARTRGNELTTGFNLMVPVTVDWTLASMIVWLSTWKCRICRLYVVHANFQQNPILCESQANISVRAWHNLSRCDNFRFDKDAHSQYRYTSAGLGVEPKHS